MSISVPPPDYSFTGLIYNPDFWISPTDGLTQDVANALYLRKTVTDTASALETFNGGIRATNYDVVGATTAKDYFTTQTTGGVELFKNMTAAATLKIGNPLVAQSTHVGNIDFIQNTINNASAPTSGVINIGNRQTTSAGLINIGTNTGRATTATIKIGHTTTDVQCSNLLLSSQSIDNASSVSNGTIFIGFGQSAGAGTLNFGTALNRTGAINIGNGANVANTSAINLSSTASAGVINVNRPLTLNYLPSAITTSQLGSKIDGTVGVTIIGAGTTVTLYSLTNLPAGIWMIQCNTRFVSASTTLALSISLTTALDLNSLCSLPSPVLAGSTLQVTRIIKASAVTPNIYLTAFSDAANSVTNVIFDVFRIA